MKIKVKDNVIVTTGKDRGKTGAVVKVLRDKDRVIVEGLNLRKRHIKAQQGGEGQVVEIPGSMHVSNVALVDPETKKATRVGYKKDSKGKKVRIAKKSGKEIK